MASTRHKQAVVVGMATTLVILMRAKKSSAKETSSTEVPQDEIEVDEDVDYEELLRDFTSAKAELGKFYPVKKGDTPLGVMREALFGSRKQTADPIRRQAAIDLLERVECGPWNQTVYGRDVNYLLQAHAKLVSQRHTPRGISYNPIYQNNGARMMLGEKPTAAPGSRFALFWIPRINIDLFDQTGVVTLEGMNWPDTHAGRGHSMIDPPVEILDLGFADVTAGSVGCAFPEGDFRRNLVTG